MEERVTTTFAKRVRQRDLGPDLKVTYRVVGGMPSQRLEYTIGVDSVNGCKIRARDVRISPEAKTALIGPKNFDVEGLFEQVVAGVHSLVSASEAAFPPDALVGSLTISANNHDEAFYFIPEEEKRKMGQSRLAPQIDDALRRLWQIARRVSESPPARQRTRRI